jgi:two-component system, NtrC family, sensor histidine kinase GlrK
MSKFDFPSASGEGEAQAPPTSRRYPSSFFRFLILAFVLVCSPLVLSLIQLTLEASSLSKGGSAAVRKVAASLQDAEELERAILRTERVVRQALALGEPVATDALAAAHEQFVQASVRLLDPTMPTDVVLAMQEMTAAEAALHTTLLREEKIVALPPELDALNNKFQVLAETTNRMAALEVASLQQGFEGAQRQALQALAVAVPLAVLLAGLFTVALSRPLMRIEDAIRAMGRGDMERPVSIGGPNDVRQLGAKLDWLRLRLRDLEGHRELLTRSISHDLKTPLTSMIEGMELLRQGVAGALNPRQNEVVFIMRDSATMLSDKIEALLTVRSSAQRDAPVELRPVHLRELASSVVARHQLVARSRKLDIRILGEDIHISGDRAKLYVVLDNLLSNAIRFSPAGGGIDIELGIDEGQAGITVSDDGPGIPAADADRIFDPGYRGGKQPEQHVPGSGLGLSIARDFVLAHGGTLQVVPHDRGGRRGARLRMTLPSVLPQVWHTAGTPSSPTSDRE